MPHRSRIRRGTHPIPPADVNVNGKQILMNKDEQFQAGLALRRIMFGPGGSDEQIDNANDLTTAMQEFVTR